MTREEKLQKAHQMFDNRNLLTELKWQREYFKRGYISNQEELFNLWIFDECIKALEQESRKGHWIEHEWEEMREKGYYRCSVCNHGYQRYTKGIRKSDVPYIDGQEYKLWNCDNYCPNCGAKMVEPQESEDT